ncbi:hypothetical protein Hanom_Chr03g00261641 [Helianthus anomalus]
MGMAVGPTRPSWGKTAFAEPNRMLYGLTRVLCLLVRTDPYPSPVPVKNTDVDTGLGSG